jgi:hypothetical protein
MLRTTLIFEGQHTADKHPAEQMDDRPDKVLRFPIRIAIFAIAHNNEMVGSGPVLFQIDEKGDGTFSTRDIHILTEEKIINAAFISNGDKLLLWTTTKSQIASYTVALNTGDVEIVPRPKNNQELSLSATDGRLLAFDHKSKVLIETNISGVSREVRIEEFALALPSVFVKSNTHAILRMENGTATVGKVSQPLKKLYASNARGLYEHFCGNTRVCNVSVIHKGLHDLGLFGFATRVVHAGNMTRLLTYNVIQKGSSHVFHMHTFTPTGNVIRAIGFNEFIPNTYAAVKILFMGFVPPGKKEIGDMVAKLKLELPMLLEPLLTIIAVYMTDTTDCYPVIFSPSPTLSF